MSHIQIPDITADPNERSSSILDNSESNRSKHERFNLRRLNMPPLKRDHSRLTDIK